MSGSRPLPLPDNDTAFYWAGGLRGELLIARCTRCGRYVHPPRSGCDACGGPTQPSPVSGRGIVHSYTVTHRPLPGFTPPFGVVLVELEEQAGLRLVSNLVDVAPEDITIGLPVQVVFERLADDVALPLFRRRE
ncbi:MAG: Zn-ribbon domain-containing OB-fold protein [Actinomycetota bacterium]